MSKRKHESAEKSMGFVHSLPSCSFRKLARLRAHGDSSTEINFQKVARQVDQALNISTPYGNLLQTRRIPAPQHPGGQIEWLYVNPFALLFHLCKVNSKFYSFLRERYETTPPLLHKLATYSDETAIGNHQHWDRAKEVQCYYWTLPMLPSWFRRRKHGWFPFSLMHIAREGQVAGGVACVMKHVLTVFFGPPGQFNFAQGMMIPGPGAEEMLIKIENGSCIQDMKAHGSINSCKGQVASSAASCAKRSATQIQKR